MADRTVSVRLQAITAQYEQAMREATASTRALEMQPSAMQAKMRTTAARMQALGSGMSHVGSSMTPLHHSPHRPCQRRRDQARV